MTTRRNPFYDLAQEEIDVFIDHQQAAYPVEKLLDVPNDYISRLKENKEKFTVELSKKIERTVEQYLDTLEE